MENRKRIYRELDAETKQKISVSSKGKAKTSSHKEHISQAMKKYWSSIPNKPKDITTKQYFQLDE
ncbi:MAG: hypothetical protein IKT66_04000 [Alistipes sp.]|nr:hypothetical protein [Alistipes sp.]